MAWTNSIYDHFIIFTFQYDFELGPTWIKISNDIPHIKENNNANLLQMKR